MVKSYLPTIPKNWVPKLNIGILLAFSLFNLAEGLKPGLTKELVKLVPHFTRLNPSTPIIVL